MATSSIKKKFVVSGPEQTQKFADAIEASFNNKRVSTKVKARHLTSSAEIKSLLAKRNGKNG